MKQLLFTFAIFVFFFVSIGLTQLLGYRKMMCSCKARRYMEARRKGIKDVNLAQDQPELLAIESLEKNDKDDQDSKEIN